MLWITALIPLHCIRIIDLLPGVISSLILMMGGGIKVLLSMIKPIPKLDLMKHTIIKTCADYTCILHCDDICKKYAEIPIANLSVPIWPTYSDLSRSISFFASLNKCIGQKFIGKMRLKQICKCENYTFHRRYHICTLIQVLPLRDRGCLASGCTYS